MILRLLPTLPLLTLSEAEAIKLGLLAEQPLPLVFVLWYESQSLALFPLSPTSNLNYILFGDRVYVSHFLSFLCFRTHGSHKRKLQL